MTRISGINIPIEKPILISLTYIYGIGKNTSKKILKIAKINFSTKCRKLHEKQVKSINYIIDKKYKVEGELKSKTMKNIKSLIDIRCYRGIRHTKKLPVRGQRTHTNARTRKGKSIAIAGKKKIIK